MYSKIKCFFSSSINLHNFNYSKLVYIHINKIIIVTNKKLKKKIKSSN